VPSRAPRRSRLPRIDRASLPSGRAPPLAPDPARRGRDPRRSRRRRPRVRGRLRVREHPRARQLRPSPRLRARAVGRLRHSRAPSLAPLARGSRARLELRNGAHDLGPRVSDASVERLRKAHRDRPSGGRRSALALRLALRLARRPVPPVARGLATARPRAYRPTRARARRSRAREVAMGLLVDGKWVDRWYDTKSSGGRFVREDASFRSRITRDGSSGFPAEAGRYHLYVSLACPWASRTLIFRKLKRLQEAISLSVVDPLMLENGWTFGDGPGCTPDPILGARYLYEIYLAANPRYTGRVTVPVLWDRERRTIVNNESSEIIRMLDAEFDAI